MNSFKLYIVSNIVKFLPATRCFGLKRSLYRWAGAKIGDNVRIVSSVLILGDGKLSIGNNTWIGHQSIILCSNEIVIGANCDIAPRVYIGDGTHVIDPKSPNVAGIGNPLPIAIGDGCWLCVNSTILPDTRIGNKCIIAAGSVVKGNVPSLEMWGGILAKKIKKIE